MSGHGEPLSGECTAAEAAAVEVSVEGAQNQVQRIEGAACAVLEKHLHLRGITVAPGFGVETQQGFHQRSVASRLSPSVANALSSLSWASSTCAPTPVNR